MPRPISYAVFCLKKKKKRRATEDVEPSDGGPCPRATPHPRSPFPSAPPLPFLFFFNDTAPTEIYTLSLHDALPIYLPRFAWSTPQRQKLKFLPLRRYNLTLNLLSRSHD